MLAYLTCDGFWVLIYCLVARTSFSFSAFIRKKDYYESLDLDDLDSLLGNNDSILDTDKSDIDVSEKDLKENKIPHDIQKVLDEEERNNDISSPDYNLSKIYRNWITSIPWGVASEDELDIGIISDILDKEHHGLRCQSKNSWVHCCITIEGKSARESLMLQWSSWSGKNQHCQIYCSCSEQKILSFLCWWTFRCGWAQSSQKNLCKLIIQIMRLSFKKVPPVFSCI